MSAESLTPVAVPFDPSDVERVTEHNLTARPTKPLNLTPVRVDRSEVGPGLPPPRPREIPLGLQVKTFKGVDWSTGGSYDSNRGYQSSDVSECELATSELRFQPDEFEVWHTPLLDIDVPAALVPSTTPGHSHLYIDKPMTWQTYAQLLHALADAGIIEQGYLHASLDRKHTALRTPWTRKAAD